MNKYQVYLVTNETIYIEADDVSTDSVCGIVRFTKGGYNNVIAVFTLSNICGFEQVNEFDDEEDDE